MNPSHDVELLAIGAGPSNLALAVALEEIGPASLAGRTLIVERAPSAAWQPGMLLPQAQSQVSFLKDLVTLRNPRSRFSFVNYLHEAGRLDDFINLGTFFPYRHEISDYLQWVAASLEQVQVRLGAGCERVSPVPGRGGVSGWRAELSDGSTVCSRHLAIGAGRDPHVPEVFAGLPAERVVHSTRYLTAVPALREAGVERVAVIGGAQSAAEIFQAVQTDIPGCRATMIMRSIGLTGYENSKFTNELFYPSFVDEFYEARAEARSQLLREMHKTNYSGLAPGLLESLYRQRYLDRLSGERRLEVRTLSDVVAARERGGELVLDVRDRKTGAVEPLACDAVLLGTGFERAMPWLVRDLAGKLGLRSVEVTRTYRLVAPGPASCYVQGVNEATHGIADSLLSVVSARAAEIVADLSRRLAPVLSTLAA